MLNQRRSAYDKAQKQLNSFPSTEYAVGVQEAKKITDAKVLVRGEKGQQGDAAPRGFLSAIDSVMDPDQEMAKSIPKDQSGRLQLARWLTDAEHPLTARVAVNRIWHHLIGKGIVETVDNFGVNGADPSNPELLDYLAKRFSGELSWSRKQLIREIVLSRTYRMSSTFREEAYEIDPENRLCWRASRRRLEAEPLRDAILSVSGLLIETPLKESLVMKIGEGEVGRNIDTSVLEEPFDHRSVYLPVIRGIIPEELKLFDFPEPSNVQGRRDSNNTSTQSLFLMNSPFAIRAAEHFAAELLQGSAFPNDRSRIVEAYLRCFAKTPTDQQLQRSLRFIQSMSGVTKSDDEELGAWTAFCQSLISSAPFRFID